MLKIGQDIHSLTDFKRRTIELVELVLTVNGRPEVVVQQAAAYQKLPDRLHTFETSRDAQSAKAAGANA